MGLGDLLKDHRMYHSEHQIDRCILGGTTKYGQYVQALRELYKRVRGLRQLYIDRDLLQIDVDELAEKSMTTKFDERRRVLLQLRNHGKLEEMQRAIHDTEREFQRFYAQAESLKQEIGELTPDRRRELDREWWEHHLKQRAAVDFISTGRLSAYVLEHLVGMPYDERRELLLGIKDSKALISWFEKQQETVPLEEIEGALDVEKLIGQET